VVFGLSRLFASKTSGLTTLCAVSRRGFGHNRMPGQSVLHGTEFALNVPQAVRDRGERLRRVGVPFDLSGYDLHEVQPFVVRRLRHVGSKTSGDCVASIRGRPHLDHQRVEIEIGSGGVAWPIHDGGLGFRLRRFAGSHESSSTVFNKSLTMRFESK
jgi:hypothetical protein